MLRLWIPVYIKFGSFSIDSLSAEDSTYTNINKLTDNKIEAV